MAQYQKTNWENSPSQTTPINAQNLMKIENCLHDVTVQTLTNVDTISGVSGSGIIVRFGSVCQLALTFSGQAGVGNVNILEFPEGFKPYIDFSTPVIDTDVHEVIGVAYYTASTNQLVFKTFIQNPTPCKLSATYVTED